MYAMNFVQVGSNIQKELDERSMTQQSLADALSISKQVMSKIIKGAKAINVSELAKIATILGTTTDSLLTMNIESEPTESMAFMGTMQDEKTREKVEMLRSAIDEILLLEELARD
ncbi:helix-turn-helix transcriptional regulator [Bullifex sp.]|uniref:helix-turn-helix domain-containing protein n=1 Tax=Bullifex sp. TaxID=2815808 RepID=UPI002A8288DD|nr:helix-turn-helix transcriptional regulator [Bullifex sp.]MDY4067824.1 helix-turn-helix transcriptional regulator [Bullifex sp.]